MKILVSSSFPEHLNRNLGIKSSICSAFRAVLGDEGLVESSYYRSMQDVIEEKPDLVLLVGSAMPDGVEYLSIRRACDKVGAKLCYWTVDDPYEFDARVKFLDLVDYVFCNDKHATDYYMSDKAHHLPLAASSGLFIGNHVKSFKARDLDFFFCGVGFPNRNQLIGDLSAYLSSKNSMVFGAEWDDVGNFISNERLESEDVHGLYGNSRFTLNIGRTLDLANNEYGLRASTPGPRTFEAAAIGAFQLYFNEDLEITDYFNPGSEIVLFENERDLKQIYEKCFDDPEYYLNVVLNSQERVKRDHTYENRIDKILSVVSF